MKTEGLTQLRNVYPRSEFIRSLDPLFRPVGVANAPDGTLYIADMYRGVIEGAPWAKEGTYLWEKIKQHQLNKVLGHGRVWRLTYDGMSPDRTRPRMLRGNRRAAGETPVPSERVVARYGAAADRAEAGSVGGAGARSRSCGRRATLWPVSTRCGRSRGWAASTPRSRAS